MKIDKNTFYATVAFQRNDWTNGVARKAMELMKTWNGDARYLPLTKKWQFSAFGEYLDALTKLEQDQLKAQGQQDGQYEFDIEGWKNEIFPPEDMKREVA